MNTFSFTPGMVVVNAFNRETFIFTKPEKPEYAEFEVHLEPGGSGGGNAISHVHPATDETFTVRSGRLGVSINGVMNTLESGESITVPRGAPHFFVNAHEGDTEIVVRFTPAQKQLRFFLNFSTATVTHPEWFSAKGEPPLLLMALTLHTFKDHFYVAGPPIWLQKLLFAALSPIARLRGYRILVGPHTEIG
ncbi:cupin domain-containing protein [Microvirga thermotolerans]|uniref:Cupin domain-containing protein n=1 Tax=Microvirga thermotolerans TaxID=2651334 RepID=A0A5P9JSR2_9HYPH|nr:cupin domain-containing protein [Microvirga thermotolerans]QFU15119.1 cupin domain-containing protein [Microvirga thermotolerans]